MYWPTTCLVCQSIHHLQSPLGLMTARVNSLIPTFVKVTHWQCHWAMHFPVFTVFLTMGLRLFGLVDPEYAISEHLLVMGSNSPLIISGFINLSQ